MAQHIEVKHDADYMDYPSRTADPLWRKTWSGAYAYPAPVALWSSPRSGDTAHRILEWNWLLIKAVNTPEAWERIKRNNAGWINWAQNKEWDQGEVLGDKPEPMPIVEGITSIGAKHRVLEVRNGSAKIEAYDPKKTIPSRHTPETHPHLWVRFRAIDDNGTLSDVNGHEFYFPIFNDTITGECWIPLEKAHLRDGEPTWDELKDPNEIVVEDEVRLSIIVTSSNGLNVRSAPDVGASKSSAGLSPGYTPTVYEIREVSGDTWGRISEAGGHWIALQYNGNYYTSWRPGYEKEPEIIIEPKPRPAFGALQGKGFYIYILDRREYDIATWVQMAIEAQVTHVLIRAANGIYAFNQHLMSEAVQAFHDASIQVWGWHYIYPFYKKPDGSRYTSTTQAVLLQRQIARAVSEMSTLGFDGWVVNAEKEWKYTGADIPAKAHMKALQASVDIPIGFSSYRYPSKHRPFPFEAFLEYADINMPQVYWMMNDNPAEQLRMSIREYGELVIQRPVFPTGAAFGEHGWRAKPHEVTEFLQEVERLGFPGCNFWEFWDAAFRDSGTLWNAVRNYDWPDTQPIEPGATRPEGFDNLTSGWQEYVVWLEQK